METLYCNEHIITMENPKDKPEAVLVRNGVIAAVGNLADVKADAAVDCTEVDLQGKTLMPSFIDCHGHVSMTTQYVALCDLASATCMDDIVNLLSAFQKERNLYNGETDLIMGFGYDHNYLAELVHPTIDVLDRGLIYNFHTDTPIIKPDMFHSIWAAVNRITRGGAVSGPEQCVDVYDALKALTINAAYAYFEETSKGSIKVGKRADLLIADQNPLTIDKTLLKDIQVLETIKGDVTIYKKA